MRIMIETMISNGIINIINIVIINFIFFVILSSFFLVLVCFFFLLSFTFVCLFFFLSFLFSLYLFFFLLFLCVVIIICPLLIFLNFFFLRRFFSVFSGTCYYYYSSTSSFFFVVALCIFAIIMKVELPRDVCAACFRSHARGSREPEGAARRLALFLDFRDGPAYDFSWWNRNSRREQTLTAKVGKNRSRERGGRGGGKISGDHPPPKKMVSNRPSSPQYVGPFLAISRDRSECVNQLE